MSFNILSEQVFPLSEAARRIPGRGGRPIHISTIWRWATHGARGAILETALVGGVRMTSAEALQRFVSAINGIPPDESTPAAPSLLEREREILAAERKIFPAGMVGQGIAAGHGIGF